MTIFLRERALLDICAKAARVLKIRLDREARTLERLLIALNTREAARPLDQKRERLGYPCLAWLDSSCPQGAFRAARCEAYKYLKILRNT